jgi:hypothetical protein
MTEEEMQKTKVLEYYAQGGPRLWYRVAKEWNWDNGTWALEWIVSQETCTRATAQAIFWKCEPVWFLPTKGASDLEKRVGVNKETFDLANKIVRNWNAGFYKKSKVGFAALIAARFVNSRDAYFNDDGILYRRGTIGFMDGENPIPLMESYREAEKACEPDLLPWRVPDELGRILPGKRSKWGDFDLTEGIPSELVGS